LRSRLLRLVRNPTATIKINNAAANPNIGHARNIPKRNPPEPAAVGRPPYDSVGAALAASARFVSTGGFTSPALRTGDPSAAASVMTMMAFAASTFCTRNGDDRYQL